MFVINKLLQSRFRVLFCVWPALTAVTLNAGAVTFTDSGGFTTSVWTESLFGNGDVVDTRESSGGNPSEFIKLKTIPNGGSIVIGVYLSDDATFDPSTQGAIDAIGMGLDVILFENVAVPGFTDGQAYGIALRQNNEFFRSGFPVTGLQFSNWDSRTISAVDESGFVRVNPDGTSSSGFHPDFSSAGSEINFGFMVANSGGAPISGTIAGYDNWKLTVTQVPEPTFYCLIFASGVGWIAVRRR